MPHKDPEKRRAYKNQWMKQKRRGPEGGDLREHHRRYRASKRGADVRPLPPGWEAEQLERQENRCWWCGAKVSPRHNGERVDFEADHVVPLAEGGAHDAENLVIACRPCNSRRGGLVGRSGAMAPDDDLVI